MLELIADSVLSIVISAIASSGFWAYMTNRGTKKTLESEMLRGLAHDRIMFLGTKYIRRGYITIEEYENLKRYLYEPYEKLGGNGSAKKIMNEIDRLNMHTSKYEELDKKNDG